VKSFKLSFGGWGLEQTTKLRLRRDDTRKFATLTVEANPFSAKQPLHDLAAYNFSVDMVKC
jgi:hypothetical protein